MKKKTVACGFMLCGLAVAMAVQAQEKTVPDAPKPVFGAPIRLTPPAPVVDATVPANLSNMGVTNISAGTSGQSAAPATKPVIAEMWNVVVRDITLSSTLTRWGQPGGYQVLWAATKDLPAMNATYKGSFEEALENLMVDTKHSGYPLHACLYNNKVVRVLHATQSCNQ